MIAKSQLQIGNDLKALMLWIFLLLFSVVRSEVDFNQITNDSCPALTLNDSFCKVTNGTVVCRLYNITHLQLNLLDEENNITHLDLSHNCLQSLPKRSFRNFSGLLSLSLAFNYLQVLEYEVFDGLDVLKILNLAQNPLRRFTGSLEDILPSITILDLTGVTTWKPDKQVFRLPMLTQVVGFSLTNYCTNCVFFLPTKSRTFKITHKIGRCHQLSYSLTDVITRIANLVNGTAFQLRCEKPWRCGKSESTGRFFKLENFCWKDILIMLKVQGVLGIFGLIFNMVLILNILTSKSLRQNITLLFVCNMGISDFLLSVYAAFLTVYLSNHSYHYLFYDSSKNNWKVGFIWMLGQTSTVITSFFLTLERYLVIVYSLNPSVRISFRMAYLMIAICWLIAMFFTGFAFYYDFYSYTFLCIPIYLNHAYSKLHYFTIVVGSTGMGFYIISFFLYLHIYIVAKRTAQNAGVKRESQVAKRIAMVIFSNVFFFLFPIILTAALMCLYPSSVTTKTVVLTLLSLSFNSLLNPVVYAFRNDRFKNVFKSHFNNILKHMSKGGLGKSHNVAVIKKQQASNE